MSIRGSWLAMAIGFGLALVSIAGLLAMLCRLGADCNIVWVSEVPRMARS